MEAKLDQGGSQFISDFSLHFSEGLKFNFIDSRRNDVYGQASDWIRVLSSYLVALSALALSKNTKRCVNKQELPPNVTYGGGNSKEQAANQQKSKSSSSTSTSPSQVTGCNGAREDGMKRHSSGSGSGGDDREDKQSAKRVPADKVGDADSDQQKEQQEQQQQQQQKETQLNVPDTQANTSPPPNVIAYHYNKTPQPESKTDSQDMQQHTQVLPPPTKPLGEDAIRQRRLARFGQTSPTGTNGEISPTHPPDPASRSASSVTTTPRSTKAISDSKKAISDSKKHPEGQSQKASLRASNVSPTQSTDTARENPSNISTPVKSDMSTSLVTLLSDSKSDAKPTSDEESEKEIDEEELMVDMLSQLLDYKLVVVDAAEHNPRPTRGIIFISPSHIPKEDDMERKLQELFILCLVKEEDPVRYCLLCYDRAKCKIAESKMKAVVGVAKYLLEMSVRVALEQLVEMTEVPVEDDLWSIFTQQRQSKGPVSAFVSRIGGCPSDGVPVPADFLRSFVDLAVQSQTGEKALIELICTAANNIKTVPRLDEMLLETGDSFAALELLLSKPPVLNIVGDVLEREIKNAGEKGIFFENDSIWSNILGTSPMVDPLVKPLSKTADCVLKLPNFPSASVGDTNAMQGHVRNGLQKCQAVVHATLHKLLKTPKKESVIAWMAAVVSLNEARDAPHFRGKKTEKTYANDSVMVNFCSVMLKFCQPFFSARPSPKLAKISHLYCTLPSCRLDMENEPCMAMGCIHALDSRQEDHRRFLVEESSNFLTECFFLTQRALHVGLMTTITHFERLLSDMIKAREAKVVIPGDDWNNRILLLVVSWGTSLWDPRFVQLCSEFYITQSAWLMMKLEECKKPGLSEAEIMAAQQSVFSHIPEYCVKDMAQWFRFLVMHCSNLLRSLPIQIGTFVECCVTLLQRPDLLPSALSQSRIVRMLLSFVDSSSRDRRAGAGLLGPVGWGSGVTDDLSAVVHTCPRVQESLGPALLHTYAAVDVIEGLDVDKEEFDKYGSRFEITRLIENLWKRQDCKASILAQTSTEKFKAFLSAILDTLLYQMNDSLARLANVKQVQQAKEDEKTWKALPYGERERKLQFLKNEEGVARSFMKMAISTLGLLDLVSQSDEVCQCFSTPPLSIRAAAAITNFMDTLCGSRSVDLKVKDMSKYNFDPKGLLLTITTVMLRLAKQSPAEAPYVSPSCQDFVQAMADHPDYSQATMNKASSILRRAQLGSDEHRVEFIELVDRVDSILSITEGSEGVAVAVACDTSWQDEAEAVDVGIEDLKIVYAAALEDAKYDSHSLQECHAFESHLAVQSLDPRSPKLRALMREATQLSDNLPIHQESSIFVRQDEDRMDIVRALITGPVGTPYSLGCFAFDIYFPTNYPSVPPLVKLITTGNGTVRFNPNLYADGKVCLSLLGTWHGGDATEKWNPHKSNVLQVLVSIQGMILIPDPMYNEPGYEGMRKTPEGNERSDQYNAGIRLSTVRHAMVDQLKNPVQGFDDIIKVHFSLLRDAVLLQCSTWLRESQTPEQERRLRKAVDDLRRELDKL